MHTELFDVQLQWRAPTAVLQSTQQAGKIYYSTDSTNPGRMATEISRLNDDIIAKIPTFLNETRKRETSQEYTEYKLKFSFEGEPPRASSLSYCCYHPLLCAMKWKYIFSLR